MNALAPTSSWTAVCHIEDIPKLGSRVVHHSGCEPIAVFRASDDHVFAVIDRCPHKGGPLSAGLVHGHNVTCPLHGWNINLEDGQALAPDQGCAHKLEVRIHAGQVLLALPESASPTRQG
ncbi:nitrite reductase small subunit NirD [Pollutimonas harenae]|uniref:Nitrite reductase small subunit NirD n=1 Tax=Pollutimonas harenae TaxID=657015 RepID=A0A853GQY2_9BURK|nr:nitrite reductase small subunit NirD [Pollutimonas harenae]NYT84567.1 nitrite reductase small subunit NirD [Pollutimonas harenae]TEA73040.1 nitrite reductase small subunit NirD [Pollutimonas harenae]